MVVAGASLEEALQAIASSLSAAEIAAVLRAARDGNAESLWERIEQVGVWVGLDRPGEAALVGAREIGQQARHENSGLEPLCVTITTLATTLTRLVWRAMPDGPDELNWLARISPPLQAAALAGYLEIDRALSARPGGDLAGRLARLEAIHRINRAANSSLQLTAMLDLVVEAVADVMGTDTCSIWAYNDERDQLILRAARGLHQEAIGRATLRIGQAITGEAARIRQPIAARDARLHPAYEYIPSLGEEKYRSQVSVPILRYSMDRLVGVLTLKTIAPHDFDQDDLRFLRTVAGELAIAIENAQLYQQTDSRLREKVRELATLQRVSARVAETLDLGEVLQIIAYNAAELGGAQRVDIVQVDHETGEFRTAASYGEDSELPEERARAQQELIREVVRKDTALRAASMGGLVALTSAQKPSDTEGVFSIFGMPLRTIRSVLGGICLHYTDGGGLSDEQYGLLVSFAHAAAIAIENARLYADAQRNLKVKSALLQEMHHRVRNNLQTVAGLLRMQMRRSKDQSGILQESVNRVQSIAAVHDLLSREDIGVTTLDEVAKRVVDEVSGGLTPPGSRFRFHVQGQAVEVASRQATLLALLVNEIVANSLRHGLRDRADGDIWIKGRVEGGDAVVTIEDNGSGLPDAFGPEHETGLGLQIIRTLVGTDLSGTLSIGPRPEGGTRVTVTFPYRPRRAGARPA